MKGVPTGYTLRPCTQSSTDAALLDGFRCCGTGVGYEVEVEDQIRGFLQAWANDSPTDNRVLLLIEDSTGTLVAVGAHCQATFYEEAPEVLGRSVWLVAVGVGHQGKEAAGGLKFSDIILGGVLDDLLLRDPPDPVVTAVIHKQNVASRRLFFRYGFKQTGSYHTDYLIVW